MSCNLELNQNNLANIDNAFAPTASMIDFENKLKSKISQSWNQPVNNTDIISENAPTINNNLANLLKSKPEPVKAETYKNNIINTVSQGNSPTHRYTTKPFFRGFDLIIWLGLMAVIVIIIYKTMY